VANRLCYGIHQSVGKGVDLEHVVTASGYPSRHMVVVGLAAVDSIDYYDDLERRWTQVCKNIRLKLLF
jgi:hypothetical protein